ncbi:hypothetical protein SD37_17365 [Amycolatopsis orientalis]|uniref:Uncharacterized protein n=1 Tax=Amycolatopsis orientalis TaxID=31958 RepID=A0A193BYJ0_AMYOR|nr:hypothetical protein SD37_17365 [Amycolatopsis orientalis]
MDQIDDSDQGDTKRMGRCLLVDFISSRDLLDQNLKHFGYVATHLARPFRTLIEYRREIGCRLQPEQRLVTRAMWEYLQFGAEVICS